MFFALQIKEFQNDLMIVVVVVVAAATALLGQV